MPSWERKRQPDDVPTPVAIALSDFCRRAGVPASPRAVRSALSAISEAEDFRVRAVTDAEPAARPLGPYAVVDLVRGTPLDTAALRQRSGYYTLVEEMLAASCEIHVLRDPTRGGLATTLNEIAIQSQVAIILDETSIPVRPAVRAACEMLGFDPLYVANEGKLVAIVAREAAEKILQAMRSNRYGREAVVIGEVQAAPANRVLIKTGIGGTRVLDMLSGEMLPRIC